MMWRWLMPFPFHYNLGGFFMIFSNSDYDIQAKCGNRYLVIFRQKEYRILQDDDGDWSLIARISNIVERDTALNILKII